MLMGAFVRNHWRRIRRPRSFLERAFRLVFGLGKRTTNHVDYTPPTVAPILARVSYHAEARARACSPVVACTARRAILSLGGDKSLIYSNCLSERVGDSTRRRKTRLSRLCRIERMLARHRIITIIRAFIIIITVYYDRRCRTKERTSERARTAKRTISGHDR